MKALSEMSNEELWALFPVILSPYNPKWPEYYREEEASIKEAVGEALFRISHVGGTSVPGLTAKPTVDIFLEVCSDKDPDWLIETIQNLGYICTPQPNNPAPHLMFTKGYTPKGFAEKVVHLHIRYPGDWDEFYFRDYLCEYDAARQEYSALKTGLQKRFVHDRDAYTDAKGDFVKRITAAARKQYGDRYIP